MMADDLEGFLLPIQRRGKFRKDDCFKGFQDDFDSAIGNVLNRYGARSMLADQFSNYRKIKEKEPSDTETAASISNTTDSYDIVIDMSDYVKGSLSVRTRGSNAVVEAEYDSKNYHKIFPLPSNTNTDAVKSALSDEGILTITAPKKKPKTVVISEVPDEESTSGPALKIDIGTPNIRDADEGNVFKFEKKTSVTQQKEKNISDNLVDKPLSVKRGGRFFEDPKFSNVWTDFERAMEDMVEKEQNRNEQRQAEREARRSNLREEISRKFQKELIPKGMFKRQTGDDMDSLLKEFGIPEFSRLGSYRNLRQWAPASDTQAVTVTKDSKGYKIVMDAKDFSDDGSLSVKASEGSLLVAVGKGPSDFSKHFSLPGLTDTSQVTAYMSEDGILTIVAPI